MGDRLANTITHHTTGSFIAIGQTSYIRCNGIRQQRMTSKSGQNVEIAASIPTSIIVVDVSPAELYGA